MGKYHKGAAFCFAAFFISSSAGAVDLTDDIAVTMTVESSCTLSAGAMAFGIYDPADGSTATADLSINCTNGTPYTVFVESSTSGVRTMANGSETLNYSVYTAADHQDYFPESVGDATEATAGTTADTVTVYGEVPSGQNPLIGNYADTVTVTLSY